jgi:hypothetical protein
MRRSFATFLLKNRSHGVQRLEDWACGVGGAGHGRGDDGTLNSEVMELAKNFRSTARLSRETPEGSIDSMNVLEVRIETNLQHNNPKKYRELKQSGNLAEWLKQQAELASDAMNSTTEDANEGQRAELAGEYLNPLTEEQEQDEEESPEEEWLRRREGKIILPAISDTSECERETVSDAATSKAERAGTVAPTPRRACPD